MKVFAWNDILQIISGKIPVPDLFAKGTAISVGSFDGPHIGHEKLLQALLKPDINALRNIKAMFQHWSRDLLFLKTMVLLLLWSLTFPMILVE